MRSVALTRWCVPFATGVSPLLSLSFALALSAFTVAGCGASTPSGEGAPEARVPAAVTTASATNGDPTRTSASAAPSEKAAEVPPRVSELREAGVVATFPTGWKVEAVRGGFIARAPGGTGAMALVGGVETDALNDVRHVLEREAGVEFPIGLGQRTANANGYTFFISLSDLARRDGTPVRTTTGLTAAAAGVGTDTKPLAMLIWFRRDAQETIQAAVKAIDTIDFAPRVKAERAKAPAP